MKKLLFILGLSLCAVSPVAFTSCSSAPSSRVTEVKTLKTLGDAADSVVATAAHLYAAGKITAAQANAVNDFYDLKFQPAYRVAVAAVNSDLSSIASPDLVNLAAQLAALIPQEVSK